MGHLGAECERAPSLRAACGHYTIRLSDEFLTPAITHPEMTTAKLSRDGIVAGVRWVAIGQVFGQLMRVAVSAVLAHLISPEDFGLMAMAGIFTGFVAMFQMLGAGTVIIQRPALTERLLRSLASLGIASGLTVGGALAAGSPLFARMWGDLRLTAILCGLAAVFPISSIAIVPENLLQRDLKFGKIVALELVSQIIQSAIAIGLAASGWRVWALIAAQLCGTSVRTIALVAISPWRLRFAWDRKELKGVVGFSGGVLGFNVLQYFSRNTDNMIIGRFLGPEPLGFYDYAYRMYMYPLEAVTSVLMRVMLPAFARVQSDDAELGKVFQRAVGAIALITFPMMTGLAAIAHPFVVVVLGETWLPVVPLIRVLAPVGMLHSIGATTGQVLLAKGRVGMRLWLNVVATAVFIASFILGLPWGTLGVATGYAIAMVPVVGASFILAMGLIRQPLRVLWTTLSTYTWGSLVMGLSVRGLCVALEQRELAELEVLVTGVAAGVLVYGAIIVIARPPALVDLLHLLPATVRRMKPIAVLIADRAAP